MSLALNRKLAIRALNGVLLVSIIWIAAGLTWRVLSPVPELPASTAGVVNAPAAAAIDIASIARLFDSAAAGANASALPYKLRGAIGAGQARTAAAIFSGGGAKDIVVAVGGELQPGVKLLAVNGEGALVDNHGRQERIELDAKPALKLDAPQNPAVGNLIQPVNPSATPARAESQAQTLVVNMPRAKLVGAMQSGNVAEWAAGLRSDPRKGIRVEPGSAPGLVQTLQLQTGDVLQRINGRALSQPGDITLVYNEFSQKNKVQLELLRNDRPLVLDYTLQP